VGTLAALRPHAIVVTGAWLGDHELSAAAGVTARIAVEHGALSRQSAVAAIGHHDPLADRPQSSP
jgi:hypothetical protein